MEFILRHFEIRWNFSHRLNAETMSCCSQQQKTSQITSPSPALTLHSGFITSIGFNWYGFARWLDFQTTTHSAFVKMFTTIGWIPLLRLWTVNFLDIPRSIWNANDCIRIVFTRNTYTPRLINIEENKNHMNLSKSFVEHPQVPELKVKWAQLAIFTGCWSMWNLWNDVKFDRFSAPVPDKYIDGNKSDGGYHWYATLLNE